MQLAYSVENNRYVFQGEKKHERLYGRTGERVHFQTFVISEKSTKSIQYQTCMLQYFTDCLLSKGENSKTEGPRTVLFFTEWTV